MDDLISRNAAIDALTNEFHGMISDESMRIYQIISWLSTLPTAVVRCKDCVYYDKDSNLCDLGGVWGLNDYCSSGRMEGER